ncbi:MAG: RNA-binding protein, partial [Ruminococcus sp.]|nr:RNA-binding protein [Ruminococcus sp.]
NIDFVSNYEIINFTVSSLRLDVFVSAVCNLSRANSQKYIKSEFVSVNHMVNSNFSKSLNEGDVVTIKKYGKFVFIAEEGVTKKGRLRIRVKHFR